MARKIPKIYITIGAEYPIEADFRPQAKRIGSNIVSAVHSASNSKITLGTSSVSSNIATVVVKAVTEGCAILTSTGTTSEGYDYVGKVEIHVTDPECGD